ncbi:Hypothetical protein SYNTR_0827 [Candidatus Syntrophocurvum alkaliphilum]|uniref:Uncharacterized protein n=1 Tax=Candidatus Syntrophocurvum alkaliphilum TaxID=2293317 RepID=A0A6I6DG90_9FIRM|nr:DUF456 domain-containing protein [Candidatus Syntrophocurvum alkaliphilum]QGT99420.1 Hypothetical protein SYNTR_0827 [Candidatus Syntrophocurvum alkaliphilum]
MDIFVLLIILFIMIIGFLGTFLPIIPGIPIIFCAAAFYGWYEGFYNITWDYLTLLLVLTIISFILEHLTTLYGAKYFGSSKYGLLGAIIGAIIGIFILPPLGIFIGPFLGAFLGEFLYLNDINRALKSSIGALIGLFSGILIKIIIAVWMIISFVSRII